MHVHKLTWLLPIGCWLAAPVFAWQASGSTAKRLFLEPLTTKAGLQELREDLTAELRKLSSFSLVPDEGNADFVLGGGGEIWIKGYRSFSPRSHMKMPTSGTPIYGGYLSVELKNRQGITIWSYLATPDTGHQRWPRGSCVWSCAGHASCICCHSALDRYPSRWRESVERR